MKKQYISANELLVDSFKLAEKIYSSGYRPNFIVGVWRGGTPTGIAVQEFLDYLGIKTDHCAIRTTSYYGIDQQNKNVRVFGLDYLVENIRSRQKLLIVDDVFDSGRSIEAIVYALRAEAGHNMPKHIKVACPWYKPKRNTTDRIPDFYLNETDEWLVFPHELKGLTFEEIENGKGKDIAACLRQAGLHS